MNRIAFLALLLTAGMAGAQPKNHKSASQVFYFQGSATDKASLESTISKFSFPWELLLPDMKRQGVEKVTVSFADLNSRDSATFRERAALDGTVTRVSFRRQDRRPGVAMSAKAGIAGQAWAGGIEVDSSYRGNQPEIDDIMGSEIAHIVDFFYLEVNGMQPKLNALLHPKGPDNHSWWWGNYNRDYFGQPGESWMHGFGLAYSNFMTADDRFSHQFTKAMVPKIHEILKTSTVPPVDPVPPTPVPPVSGASITLNKDMKAGTYQLIPPGSEIVPAGTLKKLKEVTDKMKELESLFKTLPKAITPKSKAKAETFLDDFAADYNERLRLTGRDDYERLLDEVKADWRAKR